MKSAEGRVAAALRQCVIHAGGEVRKVEWGGRGNAPEWMVMLHGRAVFVETKAPGAKLRKSKLVEFERIERASGIPVLVIDLPQNCASFIHVFDAGCERDIMRACEMYTYRKYVYNAPQS